MSQALLKSVEKPFLKAQRPELRSGYTVRVHQKIKEGEKERVQIFEGLIIKISSGSGMGKTFTARKVVEGVGVEKTFPVFSPNVVKIQVVKKGKVRRAKLYYMRERTGKSARMVEKHVMEEDTVIEESAAESATSPAAEKAENQESPTEETTAEPQEKKK